MAKTVKKSSVKVGKQGFTVKQTVKNTGKMSAKQQYNLQKIQMQQAGATARSGNTVKAQQTASRSAAVASLGSSAASAARTESLSNSAKFAETMGALISGTSSDNPSDQTGESNTTNWEVD